MPARRRPPFTSIVAIVRDRHPELADPASAVLEQRILVDGRIVTNPRAQVRRDAAVRLLPPRRLRGDGKLTAALDAFALDVTAAVALDVGAAAGGFTSALLRRGARRVYAVDAGFGQLAGFLRNDPRVVNLERTNVATLDSALVPEDVDLVTMDLSYTSVAGAIAPVTALVADVRARLLALVKPTFELRAGRVVTAAHDVRRAIDIATDAVDAAGWTCRAVTIPAVTGRRGAVEAFVLADR